MPKPHSYYYLPPNIHAGSKAMMFIDGENLAIRYGEMLGASKPPLHVSYLPNVFVWSTFANVTEHAACEVVRRYCYTSAQGDMDKIEVIEEQLKELGIEAPRVFKKTRGRRAKRVDISLATDMLSHAHRKNYDLAILVGGDEDYLPLLQAVASEGCRIVLWALTSGLSPALARAADHVYDLANILLVDAESVGQGSPYEDY